MNADFVWDYGLQMGSLDSLVEHQTRDRIRCPFHRRVIAVAHKRPRSFCQKFRWKVTPKHAYALDPTKSEWADFAAVKV